MSDKFWNENNINASGKDSDNDLLTGLLHLIFGAAFYGDYDDAKVMLDRGWYGWAKGYYAQRGISNRDIIKAGLGRVYFTGMAYFPSTDIIGIAGYEMTLKSMGYDVNVIEKDLKPFWSNTIHSIIALREPTIAGDIVSQYSQSGKYKLMQKTLLPKEITLKKLNESNLGAGVEDWIVENSKRKWQTVFDINNTTNTNILNVI